MKRHSLLYVVSLVTIAMAAIFAYQIFWLKGLYDTLHNQARGEVADALRQADAEEMARRLDRQEKAMQQQKENVYFTFSFNDNTQRKTDHSNSLKYDTTERRAYVDMPISQLGASANDGQPMDNFKQQGLHTWLDNRMQVDYCYLDQCLTKELSQRGIHGPHQLLHLYLRQKDLHNMKRTDTLMVVGNRLHGKTEAVDFPTDLVLKISYRVVVPQLTPLVLRRMAGILSTSVITLILLALVFVILIHIIRRQRELDELKSDFTNNMTHELKTPIAIASAANDVLLHFDSINNPEKTQRYLKLIGQQLGKLGDLVEQILSMSMERRKTLVIYKERFNILKVVRPLCEEMRLKAGKDVEIDLAIPSDLMLYSDRTHFQHIMGNLLDNAIKYSGKTAKVTIKATHGPEAVSLWISDEGIGITKEQQRHIFERFYRVPHGNHHEVKGYGLGLYFVATMMRRLGGRIMVQSKGSGLGTTFRLDFPDNNNEMNNEQDTDTIG